jgi:RHS repeat-associated protein
VPQELLDAGHRAAGVQELRGSGVAQAVRIDLHPHALAGIFEARARQILLEGFIAVQEDVIAGTGSAHCQVCPERMHAGVGQVHGAVFQPFAITHGEPAPIQVQVFQAQLFHLANPQPTLPEQVEDRPVQQRIPLAMWFCGLADPPFEIVAQQPHLLVGEEFRQALGLFQAVQAQQSLRYDVLLFLQEAHEAVEVAQVGVGGGDRLAQAETLFGIVVQVLAAHVGELSHAALLDQEAPDAQVPAPETADVIFQAGGAPIALLDMLEADQRLHHPGRQACSVRGRLIGGDLALDLGAWSYAYDALNLTRQMDARGQRICFYYDALNRVTGKHYRSDDSCPASYTTPGVSYVYDAGTNGIGHRTSMTDASGSASWTYDTRGRMTKETKTVTSVGTFVTQWQYNSADNVIWMKYPGGNASQVGEQVNFTYQPQNLVSTAVGTNTYLQSATYDAAGRPTLFGLGLSGGNPLLQTQYTYFSWTLANGQGRLMRILSGTPSVTDSLQDLRYYTGTVNLPTPSYDAVGNLLNIYDYKAGSPQTQTFTYDAADRLTSAAASGGTGGIYGTDSYTYNATTGNLASKAGVSYSYAAQSSSCPAGGLTKAHAVTTAGSNTYCYDQNGNMVKRTLGSNVYTLTYDAENRLTGVSGAATATFVYDGDGNRVKGTVGGVTTTYIGNYYEWSGSTATSYYYAGSVRVAMRQGGTLSYLFADQLGSTSVVASSSGGKTAEVRYKAWGEDRYTSGTAPTSYRYTGQHVDSYINLYWMGSRWYDPVLGRWIQPDSIVPEGVQGVQAWDRYAYVNNNPVRYNDPSGHCLVLCTAIIGGAVGAIVGAVGYTAYTVATGKEFNTGNMLLAAGGGAVAGALIGTGVGIAEGMSAAAATTAAVTGGAATTTVLNATGGDPSDEINAAAQAVQSVGTTAGQIAQGANQFWTSTTNFQGNLVYQRPDLIDPDLTQNGLTNLQRMQQGFAPYGPDGNPIQLHHMLQSMNGPIAEVTQTFHQVYSSIIHINPNTIGSGINRAAFNAWRMEYWMNRAKDFTDQ